MNAKKYIFPLIIILCITVIGYTLQPLSDNYVEEFPEEVVEEVIDYRPEIASLLDSFNLYMSNTFAESQSVGGAVAIIYKGQLVFIEPYGLQKVNTQDSINIHTVFRLASVSKGFAGVLAAKLHEANILNLDSTVKSYLPDFKLKKSVNENQLTLRQVLSQSTGVVAHSFDPSIEAGMSFNTIYNSFKEANITAKPGKLYTYQNALFSLLDTIAYIKTGRSYQQLIEDSIFTPLGMEDASVSFDDFVSCDNFAYPHIYKRRHYKELPLNDRYYNVPSAAGVNASISDMSKWLQALLGYNDTIISKSVLQAISNPEVATPVKYLNKKNWGEINNKQYGLGWRIIDLPENTVVYHGGFVEGYRSEIAYCTEKQIGIVLLLNSPNKIASEVVPHFLNEFFSYTDSVQQARQLKMQLALASQ